MVQLLRKDIEKHTKDECPRRQYKCPRCHEAGEYKERTTTHIEECPMVEVPCPRCKCQVRLARRNLPDHRLECMFEKVPCKYATIGCKEEVLRKDLGEHEGDSQTHLQIAIDTVHQLQITQENMQARSRELPFTYKFTNYEYHKTTGTRLYSPAFYTSRKGYKMCLSLDANGLGEGAGTHVTVGAYLMKGENDDHLPWPFTGEVTVELLNQLVDKNHYSMIILFDLNVDEKVSKRVVNNERASTGWGQARYIPHSELGRNAIRNCQYLKDDCLYFRVSVDAKGPSKPWLI